MATKKTVKRKSKSSATRRPRATPSKEEYERNEATAFYNQRMRVEKASLADRQEARAEIKTDMANDPSMIGERLEWLLAGNYGFGQKQAARAVLGNKRMNREAALMTMLGVVEWQCPTGFTIDAWKSLTKSQKDALDAAIKRAMRRASED